MNSYILSSNPQRGAALIMALVFLIMLTLLGLTSMNTTSLEEKMANNTRDRDLAFQSAEAALRAGEAWIETMPDAATPAFPNNAKGLYNPSLPLVPPYQDIWDTINWSGANIVAYPCTPDSATPSNSGSCGGTPLTKVASQPKYIVEKMGPVDPLVPNTIAFRITARGTGSSDSSVVMLQSSYIRAF